MSSRSLGLAVVVALVATTVLAGCRSRTRRRAAPQPQTTAQYVPPPPPSTAYVPSAPPAPPPAEGIAPEALDAANARAVEAENENESLTTQLRVEQERAERAENQIRGLKDQLRVMENTPPAGTVATPAQPPASDASRLAEVLRTQCRADVIREGNLVIVRVSDAFKPGSDLLKNDVQLVTTLNATANALHQHPAASVAVVGHSDGDPIRKTKNKWSSNEHLSKARADRVARVLSDNGIQDARISTEGLGFNQPLIAPERTRTDKARNRRVEIMIRL